MQIQGIEFFLEEQQTGTISGTVHDESNSPIAGIWVWAESYEDSAGERIGNGDTTDSQGHFTITLPIGSYRVQTDSDGWARQYFDHTYYYGQATQVEVNANADTSGIDFTLVPGGSISGKVTDSSGNALEHISIRCFDETGECCAGADTDKQGNYNMTGLPYGSYKLRAPSPWMDLSNDANYVGQWYPGVSSRFEAETITVEASNDSISGIDFSLAPQQIVTITIPDANLLAAVREAAGKAPEESISNIDMLKLTGFDASNRGISNLSGLEYAANLQYLNLSDNQICDISKLAGLNQLEYLVLANNQISDVSVIANLTALKGLGLARNNSISSLTPLVANTNLEILNINDIGINNISFIQNMLNLNTFSACGNEITDISVLQDKHNLQTLHLSDNKISDISPLNNHTQLEWLGLNNNLLEDISALEDDTGLQVICLRGNNINSISALINNSGLDRDDMVYLNNNPLIQDTEDIQTLLNRGVNVFWDVEVDSVSLFRPNLEITAFAAEEEISRAQFCHFLAEAFNLQDESDGNVFADVTESTEYYHDIIKVYTVGYLRGDEDGNFYPDELMTRSQYAIVMVRILGYQLSSEAETEIHDIEDHWARNSIITAVNAGLMEVDEDGCFYPDDNMELDMNGQLIALVSPKYASNKRIIWSSSDENVAMVDGTGRVTGKLNGSAIITASSEDDNTLYADCQVIVSDGPPIDECFIATAAFGSKLQPAVVLLRHFRDQYLLTNTPGRALVDFYYRHSPPLALYISSSELLQVLVRIILLPVIGIVYVIMHPLAGMSLMAILALMIVSRKSRPIHF